MERSARTTLAPGDRIMKSSCGVAGRRDNSGRRIGGGKAPDTVSM